MVVSRHPAVEAALDDSAAKGDSRSNSHGGLLVEVLSLLAVVLAVAGLLHVLKLAFD